MNEDKSARYHRLKRQADLLALVWTAVLLGGLMATGGSISLRNLAVLVANAVVPSILHESGVVVVYVALLASISEIGGLPISFYNGFVLERQFGLSNARLRGWIADELKSLALGAVLGGAAAAVVYAFIRRFPEIWWAPAGGVFTVLIVGLANLGPVLLLPLFYLVKPLERPSLRERLLKLADRAGARVLGVYEWGLAEKTKKANAALAGLGATRRILVSDTMLAEYTDDEIEVVLAHELAHHVHRDIWKGIVLESALLLAGFFVASRLLERGARLFGLNGPADVAGLPLLVLAAGAVSLVMLPAAHAMSRAYERNADRFALELTRNPTAFVSAMRRLAAQNLAEEEPSRLVEWLFYSHPPIRDRIAAAQAFNKNQETVRSYH